MKIIPIVILFISLTALLFSQEEKKDNSGYSKQFIKEAAPGSYEEMSLPKEKLLKLKQYEPFTEEKIEALVYLALLSKTQGKLIHTKINNKGMIQLPAFEKKIKDASVPLTLILKLIKHHEGPYTQDVLDRLNKLGVLTNEEQAKLLSFLNKKGTIPGIPQEEMIIAVLDDWNGIPLNSFGMIDSDKLLNNWKKNQKLKKLFSLINKHQELMEDLAKASDPRSYKIKSIQKLHKKRLKKLKSCMKKVIPLEKKIANEKSLMAYLYLAGVYQIRYDSTLTNIQDLDRDSGNLILSLLKKEDKKSKKFSIVSENNYHLTGLEKFICVDKTLLWLLNDTKKVHKELAKRVLIGLLKNNGHPPWEAPYTMWRNWWKTKQKDFYSATVKVEKPIKADKMKK